eukprot:1613160-Amphidinium_carterae.2
MHTTITTTSSPLGFFTCCQWAATRLFMATVAAALHECNVDGDDMTHVCNARCVDLRAMVQRVGIIHVNVADSLLSHVLGSASSKLTHAQARRHA